MNYRALFLFLLAFFLPVLARAEEARLRCTADTNLSSYPSEMDFNYGQSSRLRLKGIQMMALFNFDLAPVKEWRVEKAVLHLRYAGADRKLKTLGFSTVAAPWEEGTGVAEKKPGESCFTWSAYNRTRWAGPETDFTDVSFTAGHTLTAYADLKEEGDGWFSVEVDSKIVQAMIAGLSYGMAVSDEKGQTAANNDIYSKEQNNSAPYLVVTGAPVKNPVPQPVRSIQVSIVKKHVDFNPGTVRVDFSAPADALGFRVSYKTEDAPEADTPRSTIPFAEPGKKQSVLLSGVPPGKKLSYVQVFSIGATGHEAEGFKGPGVSVPAVGRSGPYGSVAVEPAVGASTPVAEGSMRVRAYSDTEKAHPISGNLLEDTGSKGYALADFKHISLINPVWDGKAIHLHAARNEFVGVNLLVEAGSELHKITVRLPEQFTRRGGAGAITPLQSLYRNWYVNQGSDWFPEICVPLTGPFDIPAKDNAVRGQKNQSIFMEILVPETAAPGDYEGAVTVSAEGVPQQRIPVTLRVYNMTLPNTLSFDVSMNAYGTVGQDFGMDDRSPEYRGLEHKYHRMAHIHRTTLAILGYGHTGRTVTNYAPPLTRVGADMRVADWSAWDAQFGPYLDGSAFADLPRKGVPITHFYLPFHEAWPSGMDHYHYQPTILDYPATITEHAMKAPPIEQAFDKPYEDAFVTVVRQFAQHFREKGWTKTQFQLYQNDKHYYKDPKQGGKGTSWWLLDEPNFRDDWLALAYFARLFRTGMKGYEDVHMIHREDISRPQWQRNYLDGLVDLMVASGEIYNKQPLFRDMRDRLGVKYWNYGTANDVNVTNLEAEAWAIRAWFAGADAIVPWQTVGGDVNYTQPDATALFLPGKRFTINGPLASLRLKALRRAQQDVEYLVLLAKAKGWDRDQVAVYLSDLLDLNLDFQKANSDDAGRYRFTNLHAEKFAAMRHVIAAELAR
jgi:hypothetical protein